jgi:hypothetical protein
MVGANLPRTCAFIVPLKTSTPDNDEQAAEELRKQDVGGIWIVIGLMFFLAVLVFGVFAVLAYYLFD